ncbi:MAG: DUF4290 domain-containing protein [Tannerella sp.]|jgi:hypothetical protein|nr:DUF4290 domain-containing protein [Tannerella sp.]
MIYNTNVKQLILPEYGRNIQNMVDYCLTIEQRDERNRCAHAIIGVMGNMFPHLRDINDFKHILWDHLAIMSDFKLDVDYPYEIIKKENLYSHPQVIPYGNTKMRYKHYGQTLERLINEAASMEEGEEKEALILLTANQMKKSFLTWNKDSVDDEKILSDLAELSRGKIIRYVDTVKLADSNLLIDFSNKNSRNNKNNKKNHQRK